LGQRHHSGRHSQIHLGLLETMIRKSGSTYQVVSEKGKNLGSGYKSAEEAKKRLRQVEYFKNLKGKGYLK
jgi:predicted transcriptional regulator with HTH domain